MIRRASAVFSALLALFVTAGCCHHRCCKPGGPPPTPFLPPPPSGPSNIPPTAIPTSPSAGPIVPYFPPSAPPRPAPALPPPADPTQGGSNFAPNPTKPGQELLLPDPLPPSGSKSNSQYAPRPSPRGILGEPIGPRPQTAEPPLAPKPPPATPGNGFPPPDTSTAVPKPMPGKGKYPGLPGLVVVKDGVATGRKPSAGGLDLLKRSNYRTVLYLHGPGADVAGLQGEVEKRGLSFTALEVTPSNLAEAMSIFNKTISAPANRPVYVADDDGLRAGVVWYVYFRTVEILNADAARVRAGPLGYTEEGDEAKTFQVAVQQFLSTRQ